MVGHIDTPPHEMQEYLNAPDAGRLTGRNPHGGAMLILMLHKDDPIHIGELTITIHPD